MEHELELLVRDFNSSCTPDPYDPMTVKALNDVAVSIYNGVYTLEDFNNFTKTELKESDFAKVCREYVKNLLKENEK